MILVTFVCVNEFQREKICPILCRQPTYRIILEKVKAKVTHHY